MTILEIRPASIHDIPALADLKQPSLDRHRVLFAAIARDRIQAPPPDGSVLLVAVAGTIVGQVFLSMSGNNTEPGCPNIQDLYVAEARRSQGIGRQLVQRCEVLAASHGFRRLTLAVNPTLNPRALALYQRLGYATTEQAPYLDGVYDGNEDWVIDMAKTLDG